MLIIKTPFLYKKKIYNKNSHKNRKHYFRIAQTKNPFIQFIGDDDGGSHTQKKNEENPFLFHFMYPS